MTYRTYMASPSKVFFHSHQALAWCLHVTHCRKPFQRFALLFARKPLKRFLKVPAAQHQAKAWCE